MRVREDQEVSLGKEVPLEWLDNLECEGSLDHRALRARLVNWDPRELLATRVQLV